MQDIREIYAETLVKLETARSRLLTELQGIQFILDNDICNEYGEPLDPSSQIEVINNLNADKAEVQQDLDVIQREINYIHQWLNVNLY
jgi:hypothetical protein